jgi:ribosome-binding protein aMBF1 (putative translation factor)
MAERSDWGSVRDRRMDEPGARAAYEAARRAHELGRAVRELREQRGWSQAELAGSAGMTQSAVARFEAGGIVPTLPVLERLAGALDAELVVRVRPRDHVA